VAKYWNAPARCQPSLYEKVYSHALAAVHGLFPATCYLCLDPGQPPALDLCAGCEADLPLNSRACPVCAAPVPDSRQPCRRCRRRGREFDLAFAPYRYEFPLVELIHRMKYRGQLPIARILGSLLGRQLASRGPPGVDAIVPVPLHAARERQRGFGHRRRFRSEADGAVLAHPAVGRHERIEHHRKKQVHRPERRHRCAGRDLAGKLRQRAEQALRREIEQRQEGRRRVAGRSAGRMRRGLAQRRL